MIDVANIRRRVCYATQSNDGGHCVCRQHDIHCLAGHWGRGMDFGAVLPLLTYKVFCVTASTAPVWGSHLQTALRETERRYALGSSRYQMQCAYLVLIKGKTRSYIVYCLTNLTWLDLTWLQSSSIRGLTALWIALLHWLCQWRRACDITVTDVHFVTLNHGCKITAVLLCYFWWTSYRKLRDKCLSIVLSWSFKLEFWSSSWWPKSSLLHW